VHLTGADKATPGHLQRDTKKTPDPKKKRQSVVLLGEAVKGGAELAGVLAPGAHIVKVKNVDDAAAALGKIDFPIATLYVIAHSSREGGVKFGDEGFVKPADIAAKFTNTVPSGNAPDAVDFRGCSVGASPKAMNDIGTALGAKSVVAGDCYSIIDNTTPLKLGDDFITKKSDLTGHDHKKFKELMESTEYNLRSRKCILNPGEEGYFATGGKFVALWFNRDFSTKWDKDKSVCYKDLKPETVDPKTIDPNQAPSLSSPCKLIQVNVLPPAGQTAAPAAEQKTPPAAEQRVQPAPAGPGRVDRVPEIVHEVLRSPGEPLDRPAREYFEPHFGEDFSRVRVHTGEQAAASARAVNALAYTVGRNVVFAAGRYAPSTAEGRRLLAHELTHVVQQSAGADLPPTAIGSPSDHFEKEAEAASRSVMEAAANGGRARSEGGESPQ
jgi:hypothetical protein